MENVKIRRNIKSKKMEEMRYKFMTILAEKDILFDKTTIKQMSSDLSRGYIKAYMNDKEVASITWVREVKDKEKSYIMLSASSSRRKGFLSDDEASEEVPEDPSIHETPCPSNRSITDDDERSRSEI